MDADFPSFYLSVEIIGRKMTEKKLKNTMTIVTMDL
jgi:hypothetical protein